MRQRDRESHTDADPHGLFFGASEDDDSADQHASLVYQRVSRGELRAERGQHMSRRRKRRVLITMSLVLVAMLAVATWLVVLPIYRYLNPADYSGSGSGTAVIEVKANDGASDIASTLYHDGVVASTRAFTEAANSDSRSKNIQPGSYQLRKHMSAKAALALLLDPAARVNSDVVITEGATTLDVLKRLTAPPCKGNAAASCGPGLNKAAVKAALENVDAVGLPTDFTADGKTPASMEGFLYPATYYFPENTSPALALQAMVGQFTDHARATDFAASAQALHITAYQELIIASIAQAEAKFPADYPKVARVVLNRLAANKPLQIDATSAYAAKLAGLDPSRVIYSEQSGPYNTYQHDGLPPTPIGNPGAEALDAAAHPADGNWMFYVNGDAQGHLFFTDDVDAFAKAVQACKTHNWGCG